MQIRRLCIDDLDACIEVASDVGWSTPRVHWSMLLRFGDAYGALDAGELSATVVSFPHEGFAFVGMMLVRRRLQGRGYARSLLQHVIREQNGMPLALIATEMGQPLYRKLGFVEREPIVTHEGRWTGAYEGSVIIEEPSRLSDEMRSALIAADAKAFETPRTLLITALLAETSRIAIIESEGRISYALAWQHQTERHIGPVVATDDTAAFSLIGALASESGTPCRISVPGNRSALRKRIEAHGLSEIRQLPLMTRGSVPRSRPCWYGIALPSTG